MKPILCLDFDGVIHSYTSGWKGARNITDTPVKGALEFIIKAMGYFEVNIFSSRSHQWGGRRAMKRWVESELYSYLAKEEPDLFNLEDPFKDGQDCALSLAQSYSDSIKFPKHKPAAMVSIDDRAVQFTGEWPDLENLKTFKPWNKKGV